MPTLNVAEVLKQRGIPADKFSRSFEDKMQKGIQRLERFQHESGGWGWYKRDPDDPFMTATVVRGLSRANELGYPVDDVSLKRGRERLREMMDNEDVLDRLAYEAFALGTVEKRVLENVEKLNSYSRALLMLTLVRNDRREEAEKLVKPLVEAAQNNHWDPGAKYYKTWDDMSIEATGYALQALDAVKPDHPAIDDAMDWLMNQKNGNSWGATKETAVAVNTILAVEGLGGAGKVAGNGEDDGEARDEKPAFRRRLEVKMNDSQARSLLVDVNNPTESKFRADFASVPAGQQQFQFSTPQENGAFSFDVEVAMTQFHSGTPPEKDQDLDVEAQYDQPLDTLEIGEEVQVTVTVQSHRSADYVMVKSPVPAGCEVVKGSGTGSFSRFEARYEKALFFVRRMEEGETKTFTYRMRPLFAGAYTVLAPSAELMYNTDINGYGSSRTARIRK